MTAAGHLVMPKLGLTMEEGTVAQWHVRPGVPFAAGDILVVIETDKIANDVEAPSAGVIEELLVAEGSVVPVSAPIARWRLDAAGAAPAPVSAPTPTPVPAVAAAPVTAVEPEPARQASARVFATPYARRLAREGDIALAHVQGSGPGGRIKAQDVLRARAQPQVTIATPEPAMMPARPTPRDVIRPRVTHEVHAARTLSLAQIEVATHGLRDIERRFPEAQASPVRIALVGMACARALQTPDATIAVDLSTPGAARTLALPLHNRGGLRGLVAHLVAAVEATTTLAERTSSGALLIIPGHTASLFAPAAPPGWPAALGLAAERESLRRKSDGEIEGVHLTTLSLSYDTEAIGNADALAFLTALKDQLEEPLLLLAG